MPADPQRNPPRSALEPLEVNASLIVGIGTALWFVAFCVLLAIPATVARLWLWTTLAGWVLGIVGLGVIRWQRSASERRHD